MKEKDPKKYSIDEVLRLEESTDAKWEYYGDFVVQMARGTPNHSLIQSNLIYEFKSRIKENSLPCKVYSSDLGLAIDQDSAYVHADLAVFCEEPLESTKINHALRNPSILIEVLSKGTEARDRGFKQRAYMKLGSLKSYILIDQYAPSIDIISRVDGNVWKFGYALGDGDLLEIDFLGIGIPVSNIYEGITFPDSDRNILEEEPTIYQNHPTLP